VAQSSKPTSRPHSKVGKAGRYAAAANFTPDRRSPRSGPKRAAAFAGSLTRPAFEKFGFPAAALLTDWAAIAGSDIAGFSAPERLKWPRQRGEPDGGGETAGTLILRVEGPRAIELQHRLPQLIERINSYFGFRAVAQVRLRQAPLARSEASHAPRPKITPRPDREGRIARIDDPRLRAALGRIAAAIGA